MEKPGPTRRGFRRRVEHVQCVDNDLVDRDSHPFTHIKVIFVQVSSASRAPVLNGATSGKKITWIFVGWDDFDVDEFGLWYILIQASESALEALESGCYCRPDIFKCGPDFKRRIAVVQRVYHLELRSLEELLSHERRIGVALSDQERL